MRLLLIGAFAATTFAATVAVGMTEAEAAVCARGLRGAACAGPRGAVAVRRPVAVRPVAACRTVIVNGVAVRRCI